MLSSVCPERSPELVEGLPKSRSMSDRAFLPFDHSPALIAGEAQGDGATVMLSSSKHEALEA